MEFFSNYNIQPNCIIQYKCYAFDDEQCTAGHNTVFSIDPFPHLYRIICIIYPKGKRPNLGYPVNNRK
jgi:hypothetical protein